MSEKEVFLSGVNIAGPLEFDGEASGPYTTVEGDSLTGKLRYVTEPSKSGRKLWNEYEFYILMGQSNIATSHGEGFRDLDYYGVDAPDPRIEELSHGFWTDTNTLPIGPFPRAVTGQTHLYMDPAIDNRNGGRSPKMSFAKRRLAQYPGIKKIVLYCCAIGGTGFLTNHYNIGDDHYSDIVNKASTFLLNNPRFVLGGIVTDQGPTDGNLGMTGSVFTSTFTNMISAMRAAIPGGDKSCLIIQRMPWQYRDAPENPARKAEIDQAHINMTTPGHNDYIERSALIDTSDLPGESEVNPIHYGPEAQFVLGRRLADAIDRVADFTNTGRYGMYHLMFDAGERGFVDINGSGARVVNGVYDVDPEVGPCLYHYLITDGVDANKKRGYGTTINFRPDLPYTKEIVFRRLSTASFINAEFFISGRVVHSNIIQSAGHNFARQSAFHAPFPASNPLAGSQNAVVSPINTVALSDPAADIGRLMVFGLTFDGSAFRFYLDGELLENSGGQSVFSYNPGNTVLSYPAITGNPDQTDLLGKYYTQIGAHGDELHIGNPHGRTYSVRVYNGFAASPAQMKSFAQELI